MPIAIVDRDIHKVPYHKLWCVRWRDQGWEEDVCLIWRMRKVCWTDWFVKLWYWFVWFYFHFIPQPPCCLPKNSTIVLLLLLLLDPPPHQPPCNTTRPTTPPRKFEPRRTNWFQNAKNYKWSPGLPFMPLSVVAPNYTTTPNQPPTHQTKPRLAWTLDDDDDRCLDAPKIRNPVMMMMMIWWE